MARGAFPPGIQYISSTHNFSGCGEIRGLTLRGIAQGQDGRQNRYLELQLFRPDNVQSSVFTRVTSTVVTATSLQLQWVTSISLNFGPNEFRFFPGDALGFYYPNTVNYLGIYRTTSYDTHSVLTSMVNSPTSDVVTITASPVMSVPLFMSVSGKLYYEAIIY